MGCFNIICILSPHNFPLMELRPATVTSALIICTESWCLRKPESTCNFGIAVFFSVGPVICLMWIHRFFSGFLFTLPALCSNEPLIALICFCRASKEARELAGVEVETILLAAAMELSDNSTPDCCWHRHRSVA